MNLTSLYGERGKEREETRMREKLVAGSACVAYCPFV